MSSLKVQLNEVYLDEKKNMVTIVRQYVETDADYLQGFRFRGDNGFSYTDHGGVYGQIGQAIIRQLGAVPLVSVYEGAGTTTLKVEAGKFYRNTIGGVVMIVGEITPDTKWYKKGYRFLDHRGSRYTEHGAIVSKLYGCLSLVEPVLHTNLSIEQLVDIQEQTEWFLKRKAVDAKMAKLVNKALPFIIPATVLISVQQLGQIIQRRMGILKAA